MPILLDARSAIKNVSADLNLKIDDISLQIVPVHGYAKAWRVRDLHGTVATYQQVLPGCCHVI
jgi:hypothetical protein